MQNTLYIPIETSIYDPVECTKLVKRGDTVKLTIKVFTNGVLADLTGQSIDLICKKSDGTLIQTEIDMNNISNGVVTAKLDVQSTVVEGHVNGELQLNDANGQNSTNTFTFNVSASIADNVIEVSKHDINVLNDLRDLIATGEATIAQYQEHILAIANSIEAIEALENIKSYVDTNLLALESNNAQAVVNNNNLQNVITVGTSLLNSLEDFENQHEDVTNISNQLSAIDSQLSDTAYNIKSPPTPFVGCKVDELTDDSIALSNLLNSIDNATYILNGTLKIDSEVIISKKIKLIGGQNAKIIGNGSLRINYDGVEIEKIFFNTNTRAITVNYGINNWKIKKNIFEVGTLSNHIAVYVDAFDYSVQYCKDAEISGNIFKNCKCGLWVVGIESSKINDNLFMHTTTDNTAYNIVIMSGLYNTIEKNCIYGGLTGIVHKPAAPFYCQGTVGNIIRDNKIYDTWEEGISLDCYVNLPDKTTSRKTLLISSASRVGDKSQYVSVNYPEAYDSYTKYIVFLSGVLKGKIFKCVYSNGTANYIMGCKTLPSTGDRILVVMPFLENLIEGNKLVRCGRNQNLPTYYSTNGYSTTENGEQLNDRGIDLFGNCFYNTVINNTLIDCGIGLWGMSGVCNPDQNYAPSYGNKIKNNTIRGGQLLIHGYQFGSGTNDLTFVAYKNDVRDNELLDDSVSIFDNQTMLIENNNSGFVYSDINNSHLEKTSLDKLEYRGKKTAIPDSIDTAFSQFVTPNSTYFNCDVEILYNIGDQHCVSQKWNCSGRRTNGGAWNVSTPTKISESSPTANSGYASVGSGVLSATATSSGTDQPMTVSLSVNTAVGGFISPKNYDISYNVKINSYNVNLFTFTNL